MMVEKPSSPRQFPTQIIQVVLSSLESEARCSASRGRVDNNCRVADDVPQSRGLEMQAPVEVKNQIEVVVQVIR